MEAKFITDFMSCTETYIGVSGDIDPKEAIKLYIDKYADEADMNDFITLIASNGTYEDSEDCEQCGHYPYKYEFTMEV